MKIVKLILSTLLFFPAITSAAGISVTPSKLEFTLTEKKITSQKIIVANPTADVQIFEVFVGDFTNVIKPDPSSFTLEAGGKKTATITIDPANLQANQIISTDLSVVGRLLKDDALKVSTGVKIPLIVKFESPSSTKNLFKTRAGPIVLLTLVVACLLSKKLIFKKY